MAVRPLLVLLALTAMPIASAHGDLAINELETLAIRDFEGQEDSFPWEGFEIWDVYVGEGYNETFDMDGVYFKANFAGDGTKRPSGSGQWTITFTFAVGEQAFEREIVHDGTTITTTFESLQWLVADGNVLQVKAWVPVENATGAALHDLTLVSAVDGSPRDTAPGGVHDPATGSELPVEAPSTVVFPPMGEGRIVEEVPLTGPAKFLNVSVEPAGNGSFALTVTNPLAEQGQHVFLRAPPSAGWQVDADVWMVELAGGASSVLQVSPRVADGATGEVAPLELDVVTDIGGRRVMYAFLAEDGVRLVDSPDLAQSGSVPESAKATPGPTLLATLAVALVLAMLRRR